jgi:3D (Asp-Asp-Asp) domain-containing protein
VTDMKDVKNRLRILGYYDGPLDDDVMEENFIEDVRRFQHDYGLKPDGVYGPNTDATLFAVWAPTLNAFGQRTLQQPIFKHMLRWKLTSYYIAEQGQKDTAQQVPVLDPKGVVLTHLEPLEFAAAALEGTIKLRDGRMLNVASNPDYLPCDPHVFQPCLDYALRNNWIPNKAGYAGIKTDGVKATHARCFQWSPASKNGYPSIAGVECDPWRTLAADVGILKIARHDPTYKGHGGVVPRGTKVFILEYAGRKLPDGTTHDGWFTVNDTGGGIFGAHFDVFVGTPSLYRKVPTPALAHIWFDGCEKKLGMNYSYGL